MIVYIIMKQRKPKFNDDKIFIHAVWATEEQAKIVAKRCNDADVNNDYFIDDTHELNNDLEKG